MSANQLILPCQPVRRGTALTIAVICLRAAVLASTASAQETLLPQSSPPPNDEHHARLAGELQSKWLSNASCVKCHFHVPQRPASSSLAASLLKKGYLSGLGYLSHVEHHAKGQQCANCHDAATELRGECTRGDDCLRNIGNQKKLTYLGVSVGAVPPAVRLHVKLPNDAGLMVESIEPDSPAAKAELRTYDILEKLDRQLLVNQEQFSVLIKTRQPGDEIPLELIRANEPKTLRVQLGERVVENAVDQVVVKYWEAGKDVAVEHAIHFLQDAQSPQAAGFVPHGATDDNEPNRITYLGVNTSPPPDALVEQLALAQGLYLVIDSVEPDSPAAAAGLRPFDVLQKLDDQLLINTEQLTVLVRNHRPGDEVELTLVREGRPLKVRAKLGERQIGDAAKLKETVLAEMDLDLITANFHLANAQLAEALDLSNRHDNVNDEEYARRVYLDLSGTPPSQQELTEFLSDDGPNKRQRLIDRLLTRPDVVKKLGRSAVLQWSDGEHSLVLTTGDAGEKRLLAKDKQGDVLFDGAVSTEEQRQQLGPRLAAKLELMVKGLAGAPGAQVPTDAEAAMEKVLPRFQAAQEPLARLLDRLRAETGANIVVDSKALAAAGANLDEPLSFDLHHVRAGSALKALLALAGGKARLKYESLDGIILITVER